MSEVLEYAAHLSQVIGPRPGGTEEEQQASFFIEKTMSQKFGMETSVEEFNCNPNYELPRIICCIVSVLLGILCIFLPLLLIPSIIVCLIMAALYIMEVMGVSPLNRTAKRGLSQNIVAKYIPHANQLDLDGMTDPDAIDIDATAEEIASGKAGRSGKSSKRSKIQARGAQARKRKIVILARYDTGKVCRELRQPIFSILDKIHYAEMGGLVLIPVVLFLRTITSAEGPLLIFFDVLTVIGIIGAFLPILIYAMHQTAPYSAGANNNAAGVAVMMEVARHLSERAKAGQYSVPTIEEVFAVEEETPEGEEAAVAVAADGPVIHGEEAVRASGMLPVDVDLVYEESSANTLSEHTPQAEAERAEALVANGVIPLADNVGAQAEAAPSVQQPSASMLPISAQIGGAQVQGAVIVPEGAQISDGVPLPTGAQIAGAQAAQEEPAEEGFVNPWLAMKGESQKAQADKQDMGAVDIAAAFAANSIASEPAPQAEPITADAFTQFTPPKNEVRQKAENKDVPDWFKKGIQKANEKKEASTQKSSFNNASQPEGEEDKPAYRSKLADALDAAASEPKQPEEEEKPKVSLENDERLIKMREHIMNAGAGLRAAIPAEVQGQAEGEASSEEAETTDVTEETIEETAVAVGETPAADSEDIPTAQKAASALGAAIGEAASAAAAAVANFDEELAADNIEVPPTGKPDIIAKIEEARAAEVAATIQAAEEVAEQAAVADRTISYIPVAAELSTDSKDATGEGKDTPSISLDGSKRKKRSISLPSLTGAIEGMSDKVQDAPLADDAERAEGQARNVQTQNRRSRQNLLKDSLPSTDLPPKRDKESVSVVADSTTVTTTSFLATTEQDAQAALSSLDAPSADAEKDSDANAKAPAASASTSTAAVAAEATTVKASARIAESATVAASTSTSRAAALIPSMREEEPVQTQTESVVSTAGAFASADNTGAFEPVGDELIDGMSEDEIYVHDVDDSDYEDFTSFGAPTGPGYVEMPKSRASRFKGLFSRKKKKDYDDDISFSEAMGLGEDFDAREVGKARGGWESFRSNSMKFESETSDYDNWDEDDDWNGGAFSLRRKREAEEGADDEGRSSRSSRSRSRSGSGRSSSRGGSRDSSRESSSSRSSRGKRFGRNASTNGSQRRLDVTDFEGENAPIGEEDMIEEREQIRGFRTSSAPLTSFAEVAAYAASFGDAMAEEVGLTPRSADSKSAPLNGSAEAADDKPAETAASSAFPTEVWFVALGAELADNAGIKAFLSAHPADLHGAVIIDLDAMGAGNLSFIDDEGVVKHVRSSTRMKRYVTKAGTSLGMHINSANINWRETAAYFTGRKGLQTIHMAGMLDKKPAYEGEADDVLENLSEEKLLQNTAFILELLNTI